MRHTEIYEILRVLCGEIHLAQENNTTEYTAHPALYGILPALRARCGKNTPIYCSHSAPSAL